MKQNEGMRNKYRKETILKGRPCTQSSYFQQPRNHTRNFKDRQKDQYSRYQPIVSANYEQEYFRQVENGRLLKSLVNPKRDKLIVKSLQNVRSKGKFSGHGMRPNTRGSRYYIQTKTKEDEICPMSPKSYQQYSLMIENKRMGERILNTKSTGCSLSSHQKIIRKNKSPNNKVNQGIKAFFQTVGKKSNIQNQLDPQTLFFLKPFYGVGPTIISISNLKLDLNPPLKSDHLVSLQLITKNTDQKMYRTPGIPYGVLNKIQIKFALRIKDIGEFVPLRIWKFNGVNSTQIGIIDLQFNRYIKKEMLLREKDEDLKQNLVQYRNSQGKRRIVVSQQICSKLRKSKMDEVNGQAELTYLIYRKKYV